MALLVSATAAAASPDDPLARLISEGRLTDGERRALGRGEVVAKVLDTEDRSEVLTYAAAQVRTSAARLLSQLRDRGGRGPERWTRQSGRVSEPASLGDFAGLTLDAGDVEDLSRGRVNDCDVRLPNAEILSLRRELDKAPPATHEARATSAFRALLAGYAARYEEHGDPALFQYENNGDPVRISDSLGVLLLRSGLLQELAPDVADYLRTFPAGRPVDSEQHLFWTKEKFWLLDVVSLNQVVITLRSSAAGPMTVAVSKQLYATHYYESSLDLLVFVETRPGAGWLFLEDRARADIRRSGFTWIERLLLNHLVRRRLDARLTQMRARLEEPAR